MAWISALISGIGSIASSFFGFKKDQANALGKALESLQGISETDKSYFVASAAAIDSVYTSGSWLEKNWRPSLMWICMGLIVARWFGWTPPGLTPDEINHMYTFIYIGLGGYIPLRSLDKWMRGFQIGKLLMTFINKKLG